MRSGPTPGKVFPLEAAEITVGRDTTNGITINDAEVSRRHAKLTLQGNAYQLEDLGSTNGTFVNGNRLSGPFTLKANDTVSFGENIVLIVEAAFDANATMAAPVKAAKTTIAPLPATPSPATPPPSYSGQVPAGPASAPAPRKKSRAGTVVLIVVAVILLCLILACVILFLWVDADKTGARWCMIPFRFVAQMLGGVCP
jgi:predicted component of type VI protein secretion system